MNVQAEQLASLLARCALGERLALQTLYQHTSAHLYGLLLRITQQPELAHDALQESYIKIWRCAADYRPHLAQPLTWMASIARHQAIDLLRRRAVQRSEPLSEELLETLADTQPGPQQQAEQASATQALQQCLQTLEARPRQAIELAYYEDLSHEQLATRLQVPLGTLKSWVRRGLQRLKQCLEGGV